MKKKNLLILLLIPFLVALLSIATINLTFNLIDNDILYISWDYGSIEGFKLGDQLYKLEAVGVSDSKYPVSDGNQLIWSVENKDSNDETVYAEVVEINGEFYLKTLACGDILITCSNKKKNIIRTLDAVVYENGAILVSSKIDSSQNNIDPTIYYGAYDFEYFDGKVKKVPSVIELNIRTVPDSISSLVDVKGYSEDIIEEFDLESGTIKIKEGSYGDAYITLGCVSDEIAKDFKYEFEVVKDGVNVYTYDDLLNCTNFSSEGEVVVLRKSFESLQNTYQFDFKGNVLTDGTNPLYKRNNVELFGHYSFSKEEFYFESEVYSFETTYNQEYISQWNNFASQNKNYSSITNRVLAALRVQKDFYGNGYTINMHNLTFPYETVSVDNNGTIVEVPILGVDNLFRGPLPFYTLGDPNGMPLVSAFGQDNVGIYIDADNVTLNDVNVKNCDFGNTLSNLDTVGTVVDVNGDNVSIINSRLSNGKNILRVFSCANFTLGNTLLSNSRNFLMQIGTNEYIKIDKDALKTFIDINGNEVSSSVIKYLSKPTSGDNGDTLLNNFLSSSYDAETQKKVKKALLSIQEALNDASLVEGVYKTSVVIDDCMFYQSGISSISLDTMFNGPFLLSGSPSLITDLFSQMNFESAPLVPLAPVEVSGLSYPVDVNITGSTKFYDYKDVTKIDLTGLISENISTIANSLIEEGGLESILGGNQIRKITIDDIFPLKSILINMAGKNSCLYSTQKNEENINAINIPLAYYGGGTNLSSVKIDTLEMKADLSDKLEIDLLNQYLSLQSSSDSLMAMMKTLMQKTVTTVIGFEPFNFVCVKNSGKYLYGQTPNVNEMKKNLKEVSK